jgi:hypothetical protein
MFIKTHLFKKINTIIKRLENYLIDKIDCGPDSVSVEILFWTDNEFSIEMFHSECADLNQNPISSKNKDFRHVVRYSERTKQYQYSKSYIRDIIKNNKGNPIFMSKKLKLVRSVLRSI